MRISTKRLKKLIKEELFYRDFYKTKKSQINEIGPPPDMDAPGWHPNDSQEWEREAEYEARSEIEAEKKAFMATELTRWYDEFSPEDDGQADLIEDHLSECYDAIYKSLMGI